MKYYALRVLRTRAGGPQKPPTWIRDSPASRGPFTTTYFDEARIDREGDDWLGSIALTALYWTRRLRRLVRPIEVGEISKPL